MSYEQVDIESGKVNVVEYSDTEAALSALRERYTNLPDVGTKEGYAFIKSGLKEVVGYRTSLEEARKRIKAPYLEAGRIIDAEAKRITESLLSLESPMKAAKKEVDDREKRMKEERIARLTEKVNAIKAAPSRGRGQDSEFLQTLIQEVGEIDTSHDFYELTMEATKARDDALTEIGEMLDQQIRYEQAEEERKATEAAMRKQREEMEAQQAEMRRQQEEIAAQRREIEEAQRKADDERRQAEAKAQADAIAAAKAGEPEDPRPVPVVEQSAPTKNKARPPTDLLTEITDWSERYEINAAALADLLAVVERHTSLHSKAA
jgi:chromosome segregation ATPase